MASRATLAIKIIADATAAARDMDKFAERTGKSGRVMETATKASKAVMAGLLAVGTVSAKAASDLEQSAGAVDSVFGKSASKVHELSKAAADAVGLAQSEYNDLAVVLGSQLKNLGIEQGKLVGTTENLITLGSDLAATFGGTTADAVGALSSLMRGETDPIERYGVSIKAADVQARLAADGMDKLTGKAKVQAETNAKLALVMEQTTGAQGAFAREANTAAGQQARATAAAKNAAAQFGMVLLPVLTRVAALLARVASFAAQHPKLFQAIAVALGVTATAILAYNVATKAAAVATGILNAVMSANPIMLVVVAVAALAAGLVIAYKRSETFRKIVQKAFAAASKAASVVQRGFTTVVAAAKRLPRQVKAGLSALPGMVRGLFHTAMTRARDTVANVGTTIVTAIGRIPDRLLRLGSRFGRAGRQILQQFIDGMKNAAGIITGIAGNVWDAVRGLLNGAIDKINRALEFTIKVGPKKFGINPPDIPHLATGGRAYGGTLAVIGEGAEPETVLPDSLLRGLLERANAAGKKTIINITVNGAIDPDATARQIKQLLARYDRRAGIA